MGKVLDKFIDTHFDEIVRHYQNEALDLGYSRDEADGYTHDAIAFTFVGTPKQVERQFKKRDDYYIICKNSRYMAVEAFDGTTFTMLEY